MFGQHQPQQSDNQIPDQSIDAALSSDPNDRPSGEPAPSSWQHPGQALGDNTSLAGTSPPLTPLSNQSPSTDQNDASTSDDAPADNASTDEPTAPETPAEPSVNDPEMSAPSEENPIEVSNADANDLLDIKQQALNQLSPLVGHLDQTPEEKFRTTMMMIQASDDQSLIRAAFEAAQAIEDEKTRAQALLDVINEINYFTQHTTPSP